MPEITDKSTQHGLSDYPDDPLVDMLWHELDEQVSRDQIARTVSETAARFQTAKVTVFVPILVRRHALGLLKRALDSRSQPAASKAPADDW